MPSFFAASSAVARPTPARQFTAVGALAATVVGRDGIAEYADMGYNLLSVGADVVAPAIYADDSMAAFDKALG